MVEKFYWVKLHRSSVKTDDDSEILFDIQVKYNADFNTHNKRSMWYGFDSLKNAYGFIKEIDRKLPYVRYSLGN